jgi:glycine oxidase
VTERVVVVGGGVMGCSAAWELARHGFHVTVLERSVPGAEASSAAAGILGAEVEAHAPGPLVDLARASRKLYSRFAAELGRETGIDVEYRECGVLEVAFSAPGLKKLLAARGWQKPRPRALERSALLRREPALSRKLRGALTFDGDARVDPRRLFRALHIAATRAGVTFRSGAYVRRVVERDGRATGVALDDGSVVAGEHVIVAAGSWTSLVEGTGVPAGSVVPARGQIVELELPAPALKSVVFGPGAYLVPRDDGRLLIGSTLEFVGYRREVTAGAVRDLLSAAIMLVPSLESAVLKDSWSSFRPYSNDALPFIGQSHLAGLWLATGHHRNGILLAPITAASIAAVVRGRRPPVSLADFSPVRVQAASPPKQR